MRKPHKTQVLDYRNAPSARMGAQSCGLPQGREPNAHADNRLIVTSNSNQVTLGPRVNHIVNRRPRRKKTYFTKMSHIQLF